MTDYDITKKSPSNPVRRIVLEIFLLIITAIVVIWLFYALRAVLLLLAITIIFCYLLAPLVDFFEAPVKLGRWTLRAPRVLAILVVYLLLAGVIFFAFEKIAPLLSEQLTAFFENAPEYVRRLDQYSKWIASLPGKYRLPQGWRESLAQSLNSVMYGIIDWIKSVLVGTVYATKYLPWLVLIPLIGFFFLKDAKTLTNKLLTNLPRADSRYRAAIFLKDVSEALAAYMRGQVLACLLVGLIEGTGLGLLGVSYPVVIAAVAGLFEFVPILGPLLAGAAAVLVASFHSWRTALLVLAFLAIFRVIHDYFIYPRLISRSIEIHPLAIILAVLCGVELGGVIGVFLSIPVVTLLTVSLRHWRDLEINRASQIVGIEKSQTIRMFVNED